MPEVDVVFFKDEHGAVPVLETLVEWGNRDPRIAIKCLASIERLEERGHELRRPSCEYLGRDIFELRIGFGHVNYRILYFFHGQKAAVLAHSLTKEQEVPEKDIVLAVERRALFITNPQKYSYVESTDEHDQRIEDPEEPVRANSQSGSNDRRGAKKSKGR